MDKKEKKSKTKTNKQNKQQSQQQQQQVKVSEESLIERKEKQKKVKESKDPLGIKNKFLHFLSFANEPTKLFFNSFILKKCETDRKSGCRKRRV